MTTIIRVEVTKSNNSTKVNQLSSFIGVNQSNLIKLKHQK